MQQCNKNVENGVENIVSQSIASSFDAQAFSSFSALMFFTTDLVSLHFLIVKRSFVKVEYATGTIENVSTGFSSPNQNKRRKKGLESRKNREHFLTHYHTMTTFDALEEKAF